MRRRRVLTIGGLQAFASIRREEAAHKFFQAPASCPRHRGCNLPASSAEVDISNRRIWTASWTRRRPGDCPAALSSAASPSPSLQRTGISPKRDESLTPAARRTEHRGGHRRYTPRRGGVLREMRRQRGPEGLYDDSTTNRRRGCSRARTRSNTWSGNECLDEITTLLIPGKKNPTGEARRANGSCSTSAGCAVHSPFHSGWKMTEVGPTRPQLTRAANSAARGAHSVHRQRCMTRWAARRTALAAKRP